MADGIMKELEEQNEASFSGKENTEEKDSFDAKLEDTLARGLYNRSDVKKAGQDALSKVSTLLVRYNRLKDAQRKRKFEEDEGEREARLARDVKLNKLQEKRQEAILINDEEKKQSALEFIKQQEKEAHNDYQTAVNQAVQNAQKRYLFGTAGNINSDRAGGILSSLMLGGNAEGSKGYTLTTGDAGDLLKAQSYISDVTGEKGSFYSQMSLLDNAVNTGGIDLKKKDGEYSEWGMEKAPSTQDYFGSSAMGAQHSLGDMLRNMTSSDLNAMNLFSGDKMFIDMENLEQERQYGGLDKEIGIQQKRKTLTEASQDRGAVTKEARDRIAGKKGGFNDLKKAEKKEKIRAAKPLKPVPGFWSSIFNRPDYMKEKTPMGRRAALREKRTNWQKRMRLMNVAKEAPLNPKINEEDTAEKAFGMQKHEMEALQEAGKDGDKTARNMIAAYRLLGATPEELYMFRLALIAYLVPSGKKNISQILKESAEAGYVGNEDLSSPKAMYDTFQNAPIVNGVFVNNYQKKQEKKQNEKETIKNMNHSDRKKMMKALSNQEKKEKLNKDRGKLSANGMGTLGSLATSQQKKVEEEERNTKWRESLKETIVEVEEEEENNENYKEVSPEERERIQKEKQAADRNARWTESTKDSFVEEEEDEEESEMKEKSVPVLDKVILKHFEIVGRNHAKEELLQSFLEIFEQKKQKEFFGSALLTKELAEIEDGIEGKTGYIREIEKTIERLMA